MASAIAPLQPTASKSEKKNKKDKSTGSGKKRAREEDAAAAIAERKHKKSKCVSIEKIRAGEQDEAHLEEAAPNVNPEAKRKKKKKKKHKNSKHEESCNVGSQEQHPVADEAGSKGKQKSKESDGETTLGPETEPKKKKKSKKHAIEAAEPPVQETWTTQDDLAAAHPDAMDVDQPAQPFSSNIYQPPDIPADPHFPFFTQTVSLYEPIYPVSWAQPVTNCDYQYLQHLKNKYVPSLRGVLMDYRNVALSENPGRKGAAVSDDDPSTLKSFNEYAVGFGWITADMDLFIPSRGAWMEGSVNLQTEGHIGVVCFGKFNASIEARRLPPAWKWVPNEDPEAQGIEETASVITADDHGVVRQIHSTGFWVDGNGKKLKGKIRFRIRNFDVGISGETSYLSLEGTMLRKEAEKKLVKEEARIMQMRKGKKGGLVTGRRRAPEFALTLFADKLEQTEDQGTEVRE